MSSSLPAIAVHEAGHFVFAKYFGFPAITELSIVPGLMAGSGGHMTRKKTLFERMLDAERDAAPLASVVSDINQVSKYRMFKATIIHRLVMIALAGGAAEAQLASGDGSFSDVDYFSARVAALSHISESALVPYFEARMDEARSLAGGPLKLAILAVAEQLTAHQVLGGDALERLWQEIVKSFLPCGYYVHGPL